MKKKLTYAVYSDIGSREINEDSVGVCQNGDKYCFVLCDGLGGHGMGDIASSLAVDVFKSRFSEVTDAADFLGQTFCAAQDIITAEQKARNAGRKMKTTGVAVVTDGSDAYIGYVGDSRGYVFRRNKVRTRTLDHSIPQMLALSGEIKESEIRHHPDRNILLRVIGIDWEEPMYALLPRIPLSKCQAFLLCSDGFWELIEEKTMCELLKKAGSVEEWLDSMVRVVRENGAGTDMDNNSAVAVWL